jgi:peroxiredoxin
MKKVFGLAILAVSIFAISCKNSNELSISGKVDNAGEIKKVLLYETDQLVDSAFLNENNEFKFRRVTEEPDFYTLVVGEKNFLVVGKNGDELNFKTNYTDSTNNYEINGSEESEKIREFNQIGNDFSKLYKKIQDDYSRMVEANPAAKDSIYNVLMPQFQSTMDKFSETSLTFAKENKNNLAGFFAASSLDQSRYETELIAYAEEIRSVFPKNKAVQSFVAKMAEVKSVSVGQMAPEFELNNTEGKLVKLSDFKGKYVLLDFWASWCAPCREENPNIVKQFESFKDKGFTVLGVSLDEEKSDWLKAIKDDRLNWTQVSELKRWDGKVTMKYKVEGIPASFLLDPKGKILAKNLRGVELKNFLQKVLN